MIQENFIKLYERSFRENWDLPCYTDYGEDTTYSYGDVAREIARLHLLFKYCQLRRGDKIAIIGKNNSRWCIAYMAVITYGGIVVPILQDFSPNDVHHIVNHSESVFLSQVTLFGNIWRKNVWQGFGVFFHLPTSGACTSVTAKPSSSSLNIRTKRWTNTILMVFIKKMSFTQN